MWAYDTFDGEFPFSTVGVGEEPDNFRMGGQYSTQSVMRVLESVGVTCVEGIFPDTFHKKHPTAVSFVHVDMDTYMSTISALELFHPIMVEGGIFKVHDYDNWGMPGVKRAVDEFQARPLGNLYEFSDEAGHRKVRKLISPKT